jgi:hypothetical protein
MIMLAHGLKPWNADKEQRNPKVGNKRILFIGAERETKERPFPPFSLAFSGSRPPAGRFSMPLILIRNINPRWVCATGHVSFFWKSASGSSGSDPQWVEEREGMGKVCGHNDGADTT